jgi:hypothetical protein
MSNVEVMYFVYFIKKTEQSDSTLRHSAVRFDVVSQERFRRVQRSGLKNSQTAHIYREVFFILLYKAVSINSVYLYPEFYQL